MPRLFVAVNLTQDICDAMYSSILVLKNNSTYINPSRKENLHLTLAFIGESNNLKSACDALKSVTAKPFLLTFEGYGEFPSRDGSICFAKTRKSSELQNLAEEVRTNLTQRGFSIDPKPFKAHVTLCRQFSPSARFEREAMDKNLTPRSMTVNTISLMRSDRVGGKLIYTEIYRKTLQ